MISCSFVSFLQNDWGTSARPGSLLNGALTGVKSWFPPSEQPYLFVVGGSIGDATSETRAEQAIEQGVTTLRRAPLDQTSIEAAITAVLNELVFDVETTEDAAHQLASYAAMGALDDLLHLPQRVQAVTGRDVQRVARRYLDTTRRTIAWYRPVEAAALPEAEDSRGATLHPPARGAIDRAPVKPVTARRLSQGVNALVMESDLSSSVEVRVVLPTAAIETGDFQPHAPVPGASLWQGRDRASGLEELITLAAEALRRVSPNARSITPGSTHPETRLAEEFLALTAPTQPRPTETISPTVIVVTGDVDSARTFERLEDAFGHLAPTGLPPGVQRPLPQGERIVSLGRPLAQSQLGYIVSAPAPTAEGYLAHRMLLYILAHGYEGRLGKEAISQRGLAYYIDARYGSSGGPGWIELSIGVDTDKLDPLKALLVSELKRLESEPPSEAEVVEARRYLLGRARSGAQSNAELGSMLARHWLWHDDVPSITEFEAQLERIGRQDVLAVIPAFIDGMTISVTP